MKTLSFWKKSFYSALVFFGTLIVLSVGYATWNTTMSKVTSGNPLTATAWNALVDNINDLDSRWSRVGGNITFTGGNVGIGVSPGYKLDVAGDISFGNTNGRSLIFNTNSLNSYRISGESGVFNSIGTSVVHRIAKWPGPGNTGFMFTNDVNDYLLKIDSTGNVGIGTISPTERLDIGGGNIKMGWERIANACSNSSNCTATCTAGKMATGGSCLITVGSWTSIENSGGDNYYSCTFQTAQPTVVVTVYCANIR